MCAMFFCDPSGAGVQCNIFNVIRDDVKWLGQVLPDLITPTRHVNIPNSGYYDLASFSLVLVSVYFMINL